MSDRPEGENFEGLLPEVEHRTVGPHRAWCLNCSSWCYPSEGCLCCNEVLMDWKVAVLERQVEVLKRALVAAGVRPEMVEQITEEA